jgi:hypothetical protein
MSTETKKRKTVEAHVLGSTPSTLGEAWELMKQDSPPLFKSLGELIGWLDDGAGNITEMYGAIYLKAADMENKQVVPAEFRAFPATREKNGVVTAISDSEGNLIDGDQLRRLMVLSTMRARGARAVIMTVSDDGSVEVLYLPGEFQLVGGARPDGKKEFHGDLLTLHTPRSAVVVYAQPSITRGILGLNYIGLYEVTSILKALNSLAKKEDLSGFNANSLGDSKSIEQALADVDVKQSRRHFIQTMYAAFLRTLNYDERIATFVRNPSYTLANQLELRTPHSGPVFTSLGNKKLAPVLLSSLGDNDSVLLSTNIISQKEYKEIAGNVSDFKVFKDSDELGGRKGNKFVKMQVKFTASVKNVSHFLTAVSSVNTSGGSAGNAVEAPTPAKQASTGTRLSLF